MKNIRSYQTPSLNKYPSRYIYLKHSHLKIGIAVLVCLVLIISGLFYALVREGIRNRKLLSVMTDANRKLEQVNKSLGDKDLQKAFGDLHAAQKQMVAFLTPSSEKAAVREEIPQPSSVQKKALPVQVSASLPDLTREIPLSFPLCRRGGKSSALRERYDNPLCVPQNRRKADARESLPLSDRSQPRGQEKGWGSGDAGRRFISS